MPGGDRTGPLGMGPRTGREAGYCAGYATAGYMNSVPGMVSRGGGRGYSFYGRGPAGGRGWRNRCNAAGMTGWQRAAYVSPAYGGPAFDRTDPYSSDLSAGEEKEMLRQDAEALKRELEDIQERIVILEKAEIRENKE